MTPLPIASTPGAVGASSPHTLEGLLQATQAILGELSLTGVLRSVVTSARALVGARYAALGVLGADGDLAEFVHAGLDDDVVERPGPLPEGLGLLGALVGDPRPLRLEHISDDPRRAGFPEHHPSAESFLAVPITVRGSVYGNLYLSEREAGGAFSAEDQTTVSALAATAGIAIENARLYEDSRRRQHWAEAAAEVVSALLDPALGVDPLAVVADTVLRLAEADVVSVVVPGVEDATFRVQLARGARTSEIEGMVYPAQRSIAAVAYRTGRGVRIGSLVGHQEFVIHLRKIMDVGAVLALPLHGSTGSHGVLVVARRPGRPSFDDGELALSESFAAQAALAMELAAARADQQRLLVLQDRERIARDLHDHTIQRLFAAGLTLEALAGTVDTAVRARLVAVVDDLDVTIRQIRTLIFRLQRGEGVRTLRSAVLEVTEEVAPLLEEEPDVSFDGPVDSVADDALVDDVVAVCREGLSNVVRHAHAHRASLRVSASAGRLEVVVGDDGVGPGTVTRRSGLENLRRRALRHGGSCELGAGPAGGTELRWSTPLG